MKTPPTVSAEAAVADGVPDIVKFPAMLTAVAGRVFVPLVLSSRCP